MGMSGIPGFDFFPANILCTQAAKDGTDQAIHPGIGSFCVLRNGLGRARHAAA